MSCESVSEGESTSLDTVNRSTTSNRVYGSTAPDKANTTAANRVAQSPGDFSLWAGSALLVPPSDEEPLPLPQALEDLMATSKIVPPWIFNSGASQYDHLREVFPNQISFEGARALFTISDDQGLSVDVKRSLVPIFQIIEHITCLQEHVGTRPNDADRRLPVNNLTSHLWNYPIDRSFIHKLECAVQMPNRARTHVEEARPDAIVFFRLERTTLLGVTSQVRQGCSSILPRQDSVWEYVLHWVTEFKGHGHADVSKRQAWMAMASGLYQRRSLGFKDHFVFGTAHHSKTSLTVFAGKWVDHADLPEVARSNPPTEKIVIYTLDTFDMGSIIDMLQYYLLMRGTKSLALRYKASIDGQATLLAQHAEPSIHSWPPAAQPKSSAGGKKRRETDSETQGAAGGNAPQTNMADDYVRQPPHIVAVGDPLMHRFAEELSENGESAKVRGYLMSSVHDDYDYQVGRS